MSLFLIILFSIFGKSFNLPIPELRGQLFLIDNPSSSQIKKNNIIDEVETLGEIPEATGGALDLLYRYGFFSLSVRVVPRKDSGSWVIREPTASIFEPSSLSKQQMMTAQTFEPHYQLFLCEDTSELMDAYFNDFKADGVSQAHKLFSGSWRKKTLSEYMGLSSNMFDGDYSFILVKMVKRNRDVSVLGFPHLLPSSLKMANDIKEGNTESVLNFIHNYGSHYIQEISLGEVIYQVFALNSKQFTDAESALNGLKHIPVEDFDQIYNRILAPWNICETGNIKAASGNEALQDFLNQEPKISGATENYPNIFTFQKEIKLMNKLEALSTSDAVIGLHLSSLSSMIPESLSRNFFTHVIDTQISLWDININ